MTVNAFALHNSIYKLHHSHILIIMILHVKVWFKCKNPKFELLKK